MWCLLFSCAAKISSAELVPGDLIALDLNAAAAPSTPPCSTVSSQPPSTPCKVEEAPAASSSFMLPCDLALLSGSVVANESSLTGTSLYCLSISLCCLICVMCWDVICRRECAGGQVRHEPARSRLCASLLHGGARRGKPMPTVLWHPGAPVSSPLFRCVH